MKKEIVNAVLLGIKETLEKVTGKTANLRVKKSKGNPIIVEHVTTMVGVTHDIRGHVYFTYKDEDARGFASLMMMGMPVEEMNEMAKSAISELQNMSMGGACTKLEGMEKSVDITPPTIMIGDNVEITGKADKNLNLGFEIDGKYMGIIMSLEEA